MKKILIFNVLFALLLSFNSFAQDENAEQEEEEEEEEILEPMTPRTTLTKQAIVRSKKPIAYNEVNEEDILWSQTIWRRIDCRERMNFHLYYPTEDLENRKSLVQALVEGIRKNQIQAYDTDELKKKITIEQIMDRLDAEDKEINEPKMDGTGDTTYWQKGFVDWGNVREFMVREMWYIDKKHALLDVRIIALCPIRVYTRNLNVANSDGSESSGEELRTQLFWVYFPEARRVLANTICYTGKNLTSNLSFDDIFHKRYFSTRIEKMSNTSNDREISEYTLNGLEAIMESERIKLELMKMESDLWSY